MSNYYSLIATAGIGNIRKVENDTVKKYSATQSIGVNESRLSKIRVNTSPCKATKLAESCMSSICNLIIKFIVPINGNVFTFFFSLLSYFSGQ